MWENAESSRWPPYVAETEKYQIREFAKITRLSIDEITHLVGAYIGDALPSRAHHLRMAHSDVCGTVSNCKSPDAGRHTTPKERKERSSLAHPNLGQIDAEKRWTGCQNQRHKGVFVRTTIPAVPRA